MKDVAEKPKQRRVYNYLTFLAMLYLAFLLGSAVLAYKLVQFGSITASAATPLFPFTYFCADVIAEVYGYKTARQLIWAGFLAEGVFAVACYILVKLPPPIHWGHQFAYTLVLSPLPRVFIAAFVAMFCGSFLNIYIVSRWKILLNGRYFWLRSIGATTIGELIFTVLADFIIFWGVLPMHQMLSVVITSYLFKLIFSPIAVIPATGLAAFLKKAEKVDVYDTTTNFNPFKLTV